ncbi:uncharacterized protein LOC106012939 [Aplysia californica]|uniref:Uncharacterized protein LOC106012939 n=1 Tax=Aplysia californica TaxID=6500 RepID=A0ABM1A8C6_APLCA|nr:uncharacterized protein LOC106012939 [Aplysia californica]
MREPRRLFGCFSLGLLILLWLPSLLVAIKHFRGGSIGYEVLDFSDPSSYLIRFTVITGWRLGRGPCGPKCSVGDIGRSTDTQRHLMTTSNPEYFGSWTLEVTISPCLDVWR